MENKIVEKALLELYRRLEEAEILDASGETGISHTEMMERLMNRLG